MIKAMKTNKTVTRGRFIILVKGEGLSEELTFDNMRELMVKISLGR